MIIIIIIIIEKDKNESTGPAKKRGKRGGARCLEVFIPSDGEREIRTRERWGRASDAKEWREEVYGEPSDARRTQAHGVHREAHDFLPRMEEVKGGWRVVLRRAPGG